MLEWGLTPDQWDELDGVQQSFCVAVCRVKNQMHSIQIEQQRRKGGGN